MSDVGDAPPRRIVLALGGNAISPPGRVGTAAEQTERVARTMALVADLVAAGEEVILTHGNGPQVGALLLQNELARDEVPALPLDWCVAETQATIGYLIVNELEQQLAARGLPLSVIPIISRVLVDAEDPAWSHPSKPVGPYVPEEEARRRMAQGQAWAPQGRRGWRRVVPSPEPLANLERQSINLLLSAGAVVVANGGGGIPMVREPDGRLRGVEAVIDKDLAGALLARETRAERFVILTDVPGVAVGYGTDDERWLGRVSTAELRALQAQGHFGEGSMWPKVEAAVRFAEATGGTAVIAALDDVAAAVRGEVGTVVYASS
ncbi:MAG TPA: carbamate kinase [Egibacteraceae bacterium]